MWMDNSGFTSIRGVDWPSFGLAKENSEISPVEMLVEKRDDILAIAQRYGARNVRVFGSVARGSAGPESDIDFLVDFEDGRSLFDQAGLWLDLRELLGCDVDVLTVGGLHALLAPQILAEARPL